MSCTTILVGKKATNDGSTIISRNDDGGLEPKKVVIVNPKDQPKIYKSVISHLEIKLPDNPYRYSSIPNVIKGHGLWPACGINSKNVAMTATETISSNPRVLGADPYVEYKKASSKKEKDVIGGIGEEDLVTLVLPYINSAREGVYRVAKLLEQYGTYEPNGMAFSDENEIWWLETIGGHHFIAKRVPDDRYVIMPNQFGLDNFDLEDAFNEQKENICSKDLKEFIINNHLYLGSDLNNFNPRLAFGSRTDQDHVYNTPRAWYIARYFNPRTFDFDSPKPDYNPESDDIPWSLVPEHKITIFDIKYLLSSYYQGTKYNPYTKGDYPEKAKYRSIGVPNCDDTGIMQIRGYMPEAFKGLEWVSLGGSAFVGCVPFYTNVSKLPSYLSETTTKISTDTLYWNSRLIAALTDASYANSVIFTERYLNYIFNKSMVILNKYDALNDPSLLEKANEQIIEMVKEKTDETLKSVLNVASMHMKTKYNRSDN